MCSGRICIYHLSSCNLVDDVRLVCLRIDSSVVLDSVHFLTLRAYLCDSVFGSVLKLLDELVHNIDEDDLGLGSDSIPEYKVLFCTS